MTKVRVLIAGSADKVAMLDTDPPGKATLGENVYYRAKDGTLVLLDPVDLLNALPINLASTTASSSSTTSAAAVARSAGTETRINAPTGQSTKSGGGSPIVNTDGVSEGVVNKYFTRARGINSLTTYVA